MKNKKLQTVVLVIMGVLIFASIVARILKFQSKPVATIAYLISLTFTVLYGFFFYKKPHGNMLKYAMLVFAVTTTLQSAHAMASNGTFDHAIIRILASLAVCYCAGRLDRIDQNKYIMPIIVLLFFGVSIYKVIGDICDHSIELASTIRHFSYTINYASLVISYFIRYDEHKEAGLMDGAKK